tara:strand:+ start:2076 stop:6041 length:3966 start_codon:yes stop_codon:yes gene_type:complete
MLPPLQGLSLHKGAATGVDPGKRERDEDAEAANLGPDVIYRPFVNLGLAPAPHARDFVETLFRNTNPNVLHMQGVRVSGSKASQTKYPTEYNALKPVGVFDVRYALDHPVREAYEKERATFQIDAPNCREYGSAMECVRTDKTGMEQLSDTGFGDQGDTSRLLGPLRGWINEKYLLHGLPNDKILDVLSAGVNPKKTTVTLYGPEVFYQAEEVGKTDQYCDAAGYDKLNRALGIDTSHELAPRTYYMLVTRTILGCANHIKRATPGNLPHPNYDDLAGRQAYNQAIGTTPWDKKLREPYDSLIVEHGSVARGGYTSGDVSGQRSGYREFLVQRGDQVLPVLLVAYVREMRRPWPEFNHMTLECTQPYVPQIKYWLKRANNSAISEEKRTIAELGAKQLCQQLFAEIKRINRAQAFAYRDMLPRPQRKALYDLFPSLLAIFTDGNSANFDDIWYGAIEALAEDYAQLLEPRELGGAPEMQNWDSWLEDAVQRMVSDSKLVRELMERLKLLASAFVLSRLTIKYPRTELRLTLKALLRLTMHSRENRTVIYPSGPESSTPASPSDPDWRLSAIYAIASVIAKPPESTRELATHAYAIGLLFNLAGPHAFNINNGSELRAMIRQTGAVAQIVQAVERCNQIFVQDINEENRELYFFAAKALRTLMAPDAVMTASTAVDEVCALNGIEALVGGLKYIVQYDTATGENADEDARRQAKETEVIMEALQWILEVKREHVGRFLSIPGLRDIFFKMRDVGIITHTAMIPEESAWDKLAVLCQPRCTAHLTDGVYTDQLGEYQKLTAIAVLTIRFVHWDPKVGGPGTSRDRDMMGAIVSLLQRGMTFYARKRAAIALGDLTRINWAEDGELSLHDTTKQDALSRLGAIEALLEAFVTANKDHNALRTGDWGVEVVKFLTEVLTALADVVYTNSLTQARLLNNEFTFVKDGEQHQLGKGEILIELDRFADDMMLNSANNGHADWKPPEYEAILMVVYALITDFQNRLKQLGQTDRSTRDLNEDAQVMYIYPYSLLMRKLLKSGWSYYDEPHENVQTYIFEEGMAGYRVMLLPSNTLDVDIRREVVQLLHELVHDNNLNQTKFYETVGVRILFQDKLMTPSSMKTPEEAEYVHDILHLIGTLCWAQAPLKPWTVCDDPPYCSVNIDVWKKAGEQVDIGKLVALLDVFDDDELIYEVAWVIRSLCEACKLARLFDAGYDKPHAVSRLLKQLINIKEMRTDEIGDSYVTIMLAMEALVTGSDVATAILARDPENAESFLTLTLIPHVNGQDYKRSGLEADRITARANVLVDVIREFQRDAAEAAAQGAASSSS